ncbi:MAG: sigma factor, partial [Thermomicrobiales bacterium]
MSLFRRRTPPPSSPEAGHVPPPGPAPAMEQAPDHDLVARAQRGDRAAFAALYDRYLNGVYRYCYRLLGSREAAEDANTEVFLRALAALPGYRAGSYRSWL